MNKEEKKLRKQQKRLKKVIPLFAKWEKKGIDWRTLALIQGGFTPEQVFQVEEFLKEYYAQKEEIESGC